MTKEATEDTEGLESQETGNSENSGSNYEGVKVVVHVKDGRVLTPAEGTLKGITRRTALELCAELAIPAEEGPLTAAALRAADEAFATSTAGGIMPVSRIDDAPVGDGRPGPLTQRLTDLYWEKHPDPAWTTPVA